MDQQIRYTSLRDYNNLDYVQDVDDNDERPEIEKCLLCICLIWFFISILLIVLLQVL